MIADTTHHVQKARIIKSWIYRKYNENKNPKLIKPIAGTNDNVP